MPCTVLPLSSLLVSPRLLPSRPATPPPSRLVASFPFSSRTCPGYSPVLALGLGQGDLGLHALVARLKGDDEEHKAISMGTLIHSVATKSSFSHPFPPDMDMFIQPSVGDLSVANTHHLDYQSSDVIVAGRRSDKRQDCCNVNLTVRRLPAKVRRARAHNEWSRVVRTCACVRAQDPQLSRPRAKEKGGTSDLPRDRHLFSVVLAVCT